MKKYIYMFFGIVFMSVAVAVGKFLSTFLIFRIIFHISLVIVPGAVLGLFAKEIAEGEAYYEEDGR